MNLRSKRKNVAKALNIYSQSKYSCCLFDAIGLASYITSCLHRTHTATPIKIYLETVSEDILLHPYYPDIVPSNYQLFRSIALSLAKQHFQFVDSVKSEEFFRRDIRKLPAMDNILNKTKATIFSQ